MPLSGKARIEVFLPDLRRTVYRDLLDALDREFTFAFGGATTLYGLDGSYLSRAGLAVRDRVSLIYTDVPFTLEDHFEKLSRYTDELHESVTEALEEEAVLIVVQPIWHSERVEGT